MMHINSITRSSASITAVSDKMSVGNGGSATLTITLEGSAGGDFSGKVNISANVKDNLYLLAIKVKVI